MTTRPDPNTPEAPQKAVDGPQGASEGVSGQRETPTGQNGRETGAESLGVQQTPRGPVDWARQQAAEREERAATDRGPHRMTNFEAILIGLFSVAHTPEQAQHAARTVLRDHAHQLAEQQREAIRRTDDPVFYEGEAGWLVDLIDPEVQK